MKVLTLCPLLFLALNATSQITTTKTTEKQETAPIYYDSLQNFLGKNAQLYKGQTFYLKGKSESLRKSGYDNFVIDYKNTRSLDDKNTYSCCDGYHSKYESLAGEYFEVVDIFDHPEAKQDPSLYGRKHFFKLKKKSNNDILYYLYDEKLEHSFPFIVVGYYEKLNSIYKGSVYTLTQHCLESTLDVKTGEKITFNSSDKWHCKGVTIDEKRFVLSFDFENDRGNKVLVGWDRIIGKWKQGNAFTEEETQKNRDLYGEENWKNIVAGKLIIGFTDLMVKLSWGEPKKINYSSSGDQWVYEDAYLYFEGGKLKSYN